MNSTTIIDETRASLRQNSIIMLTGDVDSCMVKEVMEDILLIIKSGSLKEIELIMNSPGGEAEFGIGIIDAINYAQKNNIKVIGKVYGHAMSMMLWILQECDERIIGKTSWVMFHGLSHTIHADKQATKAHLGMMDGLTVQMVETFVTRNTSKNKTYKNKEYWLNKADSSTPNFYTAKQALELGLVDRIEE